MNRMMAMASVFMVMALTAEARMQPAADLTTIHVYVTNDLLISRMPVLPGARECASRLLAESGVRLVWHSGTPSAIGPDVLVIRFVATLPAFETPERKHTLAFAQPYAPDGTPMLFFRDRIAQLATPDFRVNTRIVGHVLAHEICHMLEGLSHHSEEGLMRAFWSATDFNTISYCELPIADEDRLLVHLGVEKRMGRMAAAVTETR